MSTQLWQWVNRRLISKTLAELEYEQVLSAIPASDKPDHYQINIASHCWSFTAHRGIWGWLHIDSDSVQTEQHGTLDAEHLFLQLAEMLAINPADSAAHLTDLYATLRADMQLVQARRGLNADQLIDLHPDQMQCLLSGHPKFIFNKGRRGFGLDALQHYAPEYSGRFQLLWIAVKKSAFNWSQDPQCQISELLDSALDKQQRKQFDQRWQQQALDQQWIAVPIHPWQWQQHIAIHFLPQLARHEIIVLGQFGDQYIAQQSLRTLTNITRRVDYDIKLPLTVYNTSCYRGIPGKYIAAGPLASRWLTQIFHDDVTLRQYGATVLAEQAAGYFAHPAYQSLSDAPYRYQEMLGVIWRESPHRHLLQHQQAILMATLMECDENDNPLIMAYIKRSGLTTERWLQRLFDVVVIPYYHLLCRYGVSLIAHGQNVTIVMHDHIPVRILLKDFQGDMRLIDQDFPEAQSLPDRVRAVTARLSADYIIHDLQTGHFVTVLRFISALMLKTGLSETRFYQLLAEVLQQYMQQHPELAARFRLFDLFKKQIIRVVLNPVKLTFSDQDSGNRMLPHYQTDLVNPLYRVTMEGKNESL